MLFQIILKLLADECCIFCLVKSTVNHLMKANYFPATPSDAISVFEQVTSGGGSPCWQLCLPPDPCRGHLTSADLPGS